ncbi:MAG: proteasome subunit alpha [Verrucomicrobia bacterium]|nr:proteasome subunit alpha [Verrucomicrobiota bacterium]
MIPPTSRLGASLAPGASAGAPPISAAIALPSTGSADAQGGDFLALLQARGLYHSAGQHFAPSSVNVSAPAAPAPFVPTQATTILAFKFAEGVLIAGDRRATAGNTIVYERADKVLEIDRHSVMAIAGVPATAWEMARVLEHSFQYYRRTQLQEMSVGGKVRALSKLLRDNFGLVMQGVGAVVPIFATYDAAADHGVTQENGARAHDPNSGRLYFYDVMGANFEVADFAATGSGSPAVRGVLYYEDTWGAKPLLAYARDEALTLALKALDTAADADSATGGVDRHGRIFPIIKIITRAGIETIADETLARLFREHRRATGGSLSGGSASNR